MSRRLDAELSFREAAQRLGRENDPDGRRLRTLVISRERQTGQRIAIRLGGAKAPKLRVTIAELTRRFPELREARGDALARELRNYVGQIDERVRQIVRAELDRSRR